MMYQFKCLIPAGYTGHARATPAKMNLFEYVMTLLSLLVVVVVVVIRWLGTKGKEEEEEAGKIAFSSSSFLSLRRSSSFVFFS